MLVLYNVKAKLSPAQVCASLLTLCPLPPPVPPVLDGPLHESVTQTLGTHATLLCEATGVPVPSVTWLKDGSPIG